MASSVNRRIETDLSRVMGQMRPRGLDWASIHGSHQGLRPPAATTGRTHDCKRPSAADTRKALAGRGPSTHEGMGCSEDLFANSIIVEASIAPVRPVQVLNRGNDNRPYYRRDRHAGRGACESHDAFSASRWPRIDRS